MKASACGTWWGHHESRLARVLRRPLASERGRLDAPMICLRFGSRFSAQGQLFYYLNGPKVIRTRDHFWASKEATAAV